MALGAKLKKARMDKGYTQSEVAAATRMKVQMVNDLEREDFSKITATIYGKGFIKLYCEHVGLDPAPLVEEYMSSFVSKSQRSGYNVYGEEAVDEDLAEEVEEGEESAADEDDAGADIMSRISSFFKKSKSEVELIEEEAADQAAQVLQGKMESAEVPQSETAEPDRKEKSTPEGLPELLPQPELAPVPELVAPSSNEAAAPAVEEVPGEPDLFSHLKEPAPVPEEGPAEVQAVAEELPAEEPVAGLPVQEEPLPVEEPMPLEEPEPPMKKVDLDVEELKSRSAELRKELSGTWKVMREASGGKAAEILDKGRALKERVKEKMPAWDSFELSLSSPPVLIVILLIIILVISGLAGLFRGGEDSEGSETAGSAPVVEEVDSAGGLMIAEEPPEPYYQ